MVAWSYLYLHLRAGTIYFIRLALDIEEYYLNGQGVSSQGRKRSFSSYSHIIYCFLTLQAYLRVQLNHTDYSDIFFFLSAPPIIMFEQWK